KEIDERLEDIIEFSELQQFIDNPVRTYSSGMYMRLAFSVAINVNADILLIDEILAVGDANFQAKCFNKLREIKANGTTIIIVSHALGQIEEICDKSIWIKDGQIEQEGDPREVDIAYLDYMNQERMEQAEWCVRQSEREQMEKKKEEERQKERARGVQDMVVKTLSLLRFICIMPKERNHVYSELAKNDIDLSYHVENKVSDAVFGFGIFRSNSYGVMELTQN
ncbi:MAG: ABC transporter ATP-binding protein, partial [Lachnospira eligens]